MTEAICSRCGKPCDVFVLNRRFDPKKILCTRCRLERKKEKR